MNSWRSTTFIAVLLPAGLLLFLILFFSVEVLHESYSSWLAPKRGRSPEAILRDNAAFKIYQTLPDKIIEDGINKACDILTGREDSPHHLSPGTAKSKERKRIAKEKVETEHR